MGVTVLGPAEVPVPPSQNLAPSDTVLDAIRFLDNFDSITQSIINGTYFRFGSDSSKPESNYSGILGLSKGGKTTSFNDALDEYFKKGGTGTTFNDPVMRYDLASMGNHFKKVDETAGIYMKDGAFFVKKKLGDHDVLEPVGISTENGEIKMFGLSSGDLEGDQKQFFERIKALAEKDADGKIDA
ncbi:MAG: hypothetical protein ACKN9V_01805 [Pseudomonadota bacterium]